MKNFILGYFTGYGLASFIFDIWDLIK